MDVEEGLKIIEVKRGKQLKELQEIIFRRAWEGQTYIEIAELYGYSERHVKDTGSKLWRILSNVLEEKVSKKTFKAKLEQSYSLSSESTTPRQRRSVRQPKIIPRTLPTPIYPELFVGRQNYIEFLDSAWESGRPHIIQIVADGGMGKSTIVWHWMEKLKASNYQNVVQLIDWSFYSEGQHQTDSKKFFDTAVEHFTSFGLELKDQYSEDNTQVGLAIGEVFARVGGVMILDGTEPLQYSPLVNNGFLKDAGLRVLLDYLRSTPAPSSAGSKRLLLITTRWAIPNLKGNGIETIDLTKLDDNDGAELLKNFRLSHDPDRHLFFHAQSNRLIHEEFKATVREYGGHALALILLASYLLSRYQGDLARRSLIRQLPDTGNNNPYRHVQRIMYSYENLFSTEERKSLPRACQQVLYLIGLFDRPVSRLDLRPLLLGEIIPELTDGLNDELFELSVDRLQQLRLITTHFEKLDRILDTHPLIREHFSQAFRRKHSDAWGEAHSRLYKYFSQLAPDYPITLSEMELLFRAVIHGCKANLYDKVLKDVYKRRIMRNSEYYASRKLGASSSLLSVLSYFFKPGNLTQLSSQAFQSLSQTDRTYVYNQMALHLANVRGFATLDAVKDFKEASIAAETITEQFNALRGIWRVNHVAASYREALYRGQELLELAKKTHDPFFYVEANFALSASLFYSGKFEQALLHAEKGSQFSLPARSYPEIASPFDPWVACLSYAAWTLWYLGYPQQARQKSNEAISRARELSDPHTQAFALYFASRLAQYRGESQTVVQFVDEVIAISNKHGFLHWLAGGTIMRGCALIMSLKFEEGISQIRQGIQDWQATEAELGKSAFFGLLAKAYEKAGKAEEGLKFANQGLKIAIRNGEWYYTAELNRIKGELLALKNNYDDQVDVKSCFDEAITIAKKQKAKSLELRAMMSLSRYSRENKQRLAEVYDWFTEGHDTRDLREAKALLCLRN